MLSEDEFFAIATRSRAAREQIPRPLGKLLPRVVGFIAVLLGAAVLYIVSSSHVQMPHLGATPVSLGGRYNPAGGAILAIILGLVLIIAPRWSREDH